MIKLRPIEKSDLRLIIEERNKVLETLRTPYMLNMEMQEDYFNKTICNRDSKTRYYIFENRGESLGYGGIENIEWENRRGEISLIIWERLRGKNWGIVCANQILKIAFDFLNLESIYGECYYCGAVDFWKKFLSKIDNMHVSFDLPFKKYFNGTYYDSFYFTIIRNGEA